MLGRVVHPFINAQHNGQVFSFGGSGDDHFLSAAFRNVVDRAFDSLSLFIDPIFLYSKEPGAFNDDIYAQVAPGNVRRIGLFKRLHVLTVYVYTVFAQLDLPIEATVVRVVLEQMCHRGQVADVVERHHLQLVRVMVPDRLQHLATNPAKSIDTNTGSHAKPPEFIL